MGSKTIAAPRHAVETTFAAATGQAGRTLVQSSRERRYETGPPGAVHETFGMTARDRLTVEQDFHDYQCGRRAVSFPVDEALRFTDDAYLDHESWIRPAMARLCPLDGRRVLDFGCGHGMAAVVMARAGARVTAFDLSPGYADEARHRARANGVPIHLAAADGERLPFADGVFDRIWGNAVLHHLDLRKAARELRRVLAPDGLAVFCEPWGENPLLAAARRYLPYPGKGHTPDERPLRSRHLPILREAFPRMEMEGHQLLSMARRVLRPGKLTAGLEWCDNRLLRFVPVLGRFCRYIVLALPQ